VTDADAMAALEVVAKKEGILCAIESAHAFAGAFQWLAEHDDAGDRVVLVNCSGRGDKDVDTAARWFGLVTAEEVAESELVRAHEGEQP
jgi:tryptophan synthase beta chain